MGGDITLYDKISDLCRSAGISVCKLEKELHLANGSISRWNRSYPSVDRLKKVAKYFDTSIDGLLGQDTQQPSREAEKIARFYDALPRDKQEQLQRYVNTFQLS